MVWHHVSNYALRKDGSNGKVGKVFKRLCSLDWAWGWLGQETPGPGCPVWIDRDVPWKGIATGFSENHQIIKVRHRKRSRYQNVESHQFENSALPVCGGAAMSNICNWKQAMYKRDVWETDCGRLFVINDETPLKNHMYFCCFCGKNLREVPYEESEDPEWNISKHYRRKKVTNYCIIF